MILDGDISPNLLMWLYYDQEQPRLEVNVAHNPQWGPSQATHPIRSVIQLAHGWHSMSPRVVAAMCAWFGCADD